MAFQTTKACSVGDELFGDRDSFAFDGMLDDFSDDGILIARASDSIIFSQPAQAPEDTPAQASEPSKEIPEASSTSAVSAPSQTESNDGEEPFVPDPAFAEKLADDQGLVADCNAFEKCARTALAALSFNKALFQVRELENLMAKTPEGAVVKTPAGAMLRPGLLAALDLANLSEGIDLGPMSMVAPRSFMEIEAEMLELAKRETDDHVIPPELVTQVMASKPTMAEEQRIAAIASCSGNQAVVVTEGTAGAGKSFTLNAIREVYEKIPPAKEGDEPGYDIIGTALSWTATKVLEESAGLSGGRAIQGLTMAMDEAKASGGDFFKRRTILIVDEAGLVGVKHMHKILWHAANSKHPVRVLLTGDSLQLCPVEAGNALEAIVDECGSSRLDTIRRQKQESHRNAVKHFCYGRSEHGLWSFWQQEAIHFCENSEERRELVMRDYVRYCISNPKDTALVLALENAEVKTLNTQIRERLKLVGRLTGDEYEMTVSDGRSSYPAKFCVGDQIVLRKNKVDHPVYKSRFEKIFHGNSAAHRMGLEQSGQNSFIKAVNQWKSERAANPGEEPEEIRQGIFNRTVGLIVDIKKNPDVPGALLLRILLKEGGEVLIDSSKYFDEKAQAVPLHHNFATTIYASQGQTVEKVLIMDSPFMARRLAYVGMSRHTMMCDIYADCEEIRERVAKEGSRLVERAWSKFEKDTKAERGPEQMRLAKLKQVISEWDPANGGGFKASDYLQAMANAWNQDSPNPTIHIAKKQMTKKAKAAAVGIDVGTPVLCLDDNPEDHLSPRLHEPFLFEDLELGAKTKAPPKAGFLAQLAQKKKGIHDMPADEILKPLVELDNREPRCVPDWAQSEQAEWAIAMTHETHWDFNRYGYPRFFSLDAKTRRPICRWGFDGSLKAGDGAPAVLPSPAPLMKAPWLVVQSPREALVSYQHYRFANPDSAESVPTIVAAPPAADLALLADWLRPGSATMHCAWTSKRPESLVRAREIASQLRRLGHSASVYPPDPEAAPIHERKRKACP